MDALGVVFGVFLGTFFCFLAAILAAPRPERPEGGPPVFAAGFSPKHFRPNGEPLEGYGFQQVPPLEMREQELVILRVKYAPSDDGAENSRIGRGAFPDTGTYLERSRTFFAPERSLARGRLIDVVSS